jgi:hypothetical protein
VEADDDQRARNAGRTTARDGIAAAIAQGADALRLLEVIVPSTFAGDPANLAAWKEARHSYARRKGAAHVVPPAPAPPAPDPSAPAVAPGTTLPKAS